MDDHEKALAIALVHAHLGQPQYHSWISSYKSIRGTRKHPEIVYVGGHYRAKAPYKSVRSALRCTTRFDDLTELKYLTPPMSAAMQRWTEDGQIVSMRNRSLEFF